MQDESLRHHSVSPASGIAVVAIGVAMPALPVRPRSLRAALWGGVSLVALAGLTLPGSAALASCIATSQVISGPSGPVASDGGDITVTTSGAVAGGTSPGVDVLACPATSIGNAGGITGAVGVVVVSGQSVTLLSNSGVISGGSTGVQNNGSIGELSNSGTISGGAGVAGILNTSGGSGQATIGLLTNSGTISGGGSGVQNRQAIGMLTNNGTISGQSFAGIGSSGSIGTLTNNGLIVGGQAGVTNGPTTAYQIDTLTNFGTIAGGTQGVTNYGVMSTLTNSGTISGVDFYGINNVGTIGSVTNTGTISGPTAIRSVGLIGPITNSGVISGNIEIDYQDAIINGGSGHVFGTLAGGGINIANGNLLFGSGNQALDESITVNGGSGTVTNAGDLRPVSSQDIFGNFVQTSAGTLDIQISGTSVGEFGNLTISGDAAIDGELAVDLLGGFTLAAGDSFDILDFSGLLGDFDSFALDGISCTSGGTDRWDCSNLGSGLYFAESIGADQLDLEVRTNAPEPETLAILAVGLAGLGMARRRRPG
ncbi:MAG TPA: PEP-CTERM sorting domain-containing protein [Acetobacteraceae bacterium]